MNTSESDLERHFAATSFRRFAKIWIFGLPLCVKNINIFEKVNFQNKTKSYILDVAYSDAILFLFYYYYYYKASRAVG